MVAEIVLLVCAVLLLGKLLFVISSHCIKSLLDTAVHQANIVVTVANPNLGHVQKTRSVRERIFGIGDTMAM